MSFVLTIIRSFKKFLVKDLTIIFTFFILSVQNEINNVNFLLIPLLIAVIIIKNSVSILKKIKTNNNKLFFHYQLYLLSYIFIFPLLLIFFFITIGNEFLFYENYFILNIKDDKKIFNKKIVLHKDNLFFKFYFLLNSFFASKYFLKW